MIFLADVKLHFHEFIFSPSIFSGLFLHDGLVIVYSPNSLLLHLVPEEGQLDAGNALVDPDLTIDQQDLGITKLLVFQKYFNTEIAVLSAECDISLSALLILDLAGLD